MTDNVLLQKELMADPESPYRRFVVLQNR